MEKEESKTDKKWSRPQKREGKRLTIFLNKLIALFWQYRHRHPDKEGKEVADKFSELDAKWLEACKKKWDSITPKRTAFSDEVLVLLKREQVLLKQRNETALKAKEEIKIETI